MWFKSLGILFVWKCVSCKNTTLALSLDIISSTWLRFSGMFNPFVFSETILSEEGFVVECTCAIMGSRSVRMLASER